MSIVARTSKPFDGGYIRVGCPPWNSWHQQAKQVCSYLFYHVVNKITLSTFSCIIFSLNVFICRILAEFLGEDQMLAVVCRSKETASAFAQSISGRFLVICLEDIRCYNRLLLEF